MQHARTWRFRFLAMVVLAGVAGPVAVVAAEADAAQLTSSVAAGTGHQLCTATAALCAETHVASGAAAENENNPVVVAGDFNLKYGGSPNAQSCVPGGYFRKSDGDVQHVIASTDLTFDFTRTIGMSYTDHSALLEGLIVP